MWQGLTRLMDAMDLRLLNLVSPPLAALALGSLGLVSLMSGRRRRVWRLFAAFCFLLMAAPLLGTLALSLGMQPWGQYLTRLIPGVAMLSVFFAVLYVAELERLSVGVTLRGHRFGYYWKPEGPRVEMFGRSLSFSQYVCGGLTFWSVVVLGLTATPLGIRSVSLEEGYLIHIEPGPLLPVASLLALTALAKVDYFLLKGFFSLPEGPKRSFVATSFVGFNFAYLPGVVAHISATSMDTPMAPALTLTMPVAVLVFYAGIVRYQFSQIDELNRGLEHKVRERTRDLELAQTRLVQSEKMASLGRLVAGIAHEINNPIAAVSSMQQSLKSSLDQIAAGVVALPREGVAEDERSRLERLTRASLDACRVVGDGAQRVTTVVARLRRFARLDEAELSYTDLRQDLADAVELVRDSARSRSQASRVEFHLDLASGFSLRCSPRALSQVWLNLLSNAVEALGERPGRVEVSSAVRDGFCIVTISDDGPGIVERDLPRVFDPGFTTKGVGVGTGLGLPICFQIVSDHGGDIDVHSRPGAGTRVSVRLPLEASVRERSEERTPRAVVARPEVALEAT